MLRARATTSMAALAAGFLALTLPADAQTLDEVLERHFEAIGGVAAWEALQSTRSTGRLDLMGGAATGEITSTAARPSYLRADITLNGMNVVQAYDGETGWMINPFAGQTTAAPADAATVAAMAEQADLDGPLVGWREDGHSIELAGTEDVNGAEAYRLEVTLASGEASTYFIDTSTHMVIRVQAEREVTGPTTTDLSDYRDVSGLMMPFAVSSTSQQGNQSVAWDTIEVNVDVDPSQFSMPGG